MIRLFTKTFLLTLALWSAVNAKVLTPTEIALPPNTGKFIGIPRQQAVCLPTADELVVKWAAGSSSALWRSTNAGISWTSITLDSTSFLEGDHAHMAVWGDTVYDFPAKESPIFWTQIVSAGLQVGATLHTSGLGSKYTSFTVFSAQPTGSGNNMVGITRGIPGGTLDWWSSTNRGRTWTLRGDYLNGSSGAQFPTVSPGGSRMGMMYSPGTRPMTLLECSNSLYAYYYDTIAGTWSQHGSTSFGTITPTSTPVIGFSGVICGDTTYVAGIVNGIGYTIWGARTSTNGAPFTSLSIADNGSGAGLGYGYIHLQEIKSLNAVIAYYVKSNGYIYGRIHYNNEWGTETLISTSGTVQNLTAPFSVPSSHGSRGYVFYNNTGGVGYMARVDITGLVSKRHYISKSGSDAYDGSSWSQAWRSLSRLNDSTYFTHGDTAIFGSGIWRERINAISGVGTDKTCYIDSIYFTTQTWRGQRVAWIYGSDSLGGWTRVGTSSVYVVNYTPSIAGPSLWQGDAVLFGQSSQAAVNSAGKFYYDGAGHIYAWVNGGDSPNNYDMEIAVRHGVEMSKPYPFGGGQDNVSIVGLGFKFFDTRALSNTNDNQPAGWDSVLISHCYMSNAAGYGGVNPSLIYNDRAGIAGTEYDPPGSGHLDGYDYNRVVACSLGTCYSWSTATGAQIEETSHGNAITFYGLRYSKVDSNVFFGHQSEAALYFKCANDAGGAAIYDTVSYNTFASQTGLRFAIRVYGDVKYLSVYGNVVVGASSGVQVGYYLAGNLPEGYVKIYNNTFYNCASAVNQYDIEGRGFAYASRHNEFKYNVIYNSTSASAILSLDSLSFWDRVDSNMYYSGGTFNWRGNGISRTFSAWQGVGMDVRSTSTINPGFNNASSGDFSRPSAITEMNRTYGGKTWTVYGAIQETVGTIPSKIINGSVIIQGGVYVP